MISLEETCLEILRALICRLLLWRLKTKRFKASLVFIRNASISFNIVALTDTDDIRNICH